MNLHSGRIIKLASCGLLQLSFLHLNKKSILFHGGDGSSEGSVTTLDARMNLIINYLDIFQSKRGKEQERERGKEGEGYREGGLKRQKERECDRGKAREYEKEMRNRETGCIRNIEG